MTHIHTEKTQIYDFNKILVELDLAQLDCEKEEKIHIGEIEPPKADSSFDVKEILAAGLTSIFASLPRWRVQAEEVEMLADSYNQLLEYWFPSMGENLTPAKNAAFSTGIFALNRLSIVLGDKKQEKAVDASDRAGWSEQPQ